MLRTVSNSEGSYVRTELASWRCVELILLDQSPPGARHRFLSIKFKVQFQHVHSRLAKKAKLPPLGVLCDNLSHFSLAHAAFTYDARDLKLRSGRRNMWIKSRCRSSDQIDRHRLAWIFFL